MDNLNNSQNKKINSNEQTIKDLKNKIMFYAAGLYDVNDDDIGDLKSKPTDNKLQFK